jgi:hypothetical protein
MSLLLSATSQSGTYLMTIKDHFNRSDAFHLPFTSLHVVHSKGVDILPCHCGVLLPSFGGSAISDEFLVICWWQRHLEHH